jgi:hypothetical protein
MQVCTGEQLSRGSGGFGNMRKDSVDRRQRESSSARRLGFEFVQSKIFERKIPQGHINLSVYYIELAILVVEVACA